jgi:hypothetical protein
MFEIRAQIRRGWDVQEETELDADRAADRAKTAEATKYLTAEGSIPERNAKAHIETADERDEAFIAKAKHNRVKAKARGLESILTSLQAELKRMERDGA